MNDTQAYPVEESKNDLIRKLDAAVNETKMKPVWRDAFMMYQMRLRDEAIKSREEGRAEGWHEKTIKTVRKMILKGYTDEQISEINELPLAEVAAIRASMAH